MTLNRLTALSRPAEWARHARTILAWPATKSLSCQPDGSGTLDRATDEVSSIAEAFARFEPVTLLVSRERLRLAQRRFATPTSTSKQAHEIRIHPIEEGDQLDLWMRDIAPTFTLGRRGPEPGLHTKRDAVLHGVSFNFNGWGNKFHTETCAGLARRYLREHHIEHVSCSIVAEGGALEVDGRGTLMASESSLVNENRNPGKSRDQIEQELSRTLGITKFIWIPGLKGRDTTDFHIDAYARFVRPGVVLVSGSAEQGGDWGKAYDEARGILERATDAEGRKLRILEIPEPMAEEVVTDEETLRLVREERGYRPVHSYVNFLIVNGGVILPQFGVDEADRKAREVVAEAFGHERVVVPVMIDELPLLGGGIHCSTQEVPYVEEEG
ncbi:hypothetical protein QQS21_011326 [Conoideocrella luteorostrata]|uniref:Agmatine deiminase n=1 Tax=Conoideocrella luteorostrata TaxID=1105319 RepID=A0AAJ0CDB3_9HYPO|nr:hypothetical protein QQS21_011326 [Conoideocrella luteorostrata]